MQQNKDYQQQKHQQKKLMQQNKDYQQQKYPQMQQQRSSNSLQL